MAFFRNMLSAITGNKSRKWKEWFSEEDEKRCKPCEERTGQIYPIDQFIPVKKLHPFCRCEVKPVTIIAAGTLTKDGKNGADYYLKYYGVLPDYYITREELRELGWSRGNTPDKIAPGKMVFGGIYHNYNGHLPSAPNRIWYEADFNYTSGIRNGCRILYSNDGLIFATYNHYETFYEIA